MSDNQLEINNEMINAKITHLPGCVVKFDIFLTPKAVNIAYAKAVKTVSKEVSVPGFRKGKAPEAFILQNYAKYVQTEWHEVVANEGLQNVVKYSNLYPFQNESVKCSQFKTISRENGAEFSVEFEVNPSVPQIKLDELNFKKIERQDVTEERIQETVNYLRRYYAKQTVVDRAVQEGDFVVLDIDLVDKDPVEVVCRDTPFEVLHGRMAEWMIKLLIGLKANEEIEGMSEKESHQHTDQCGGDCEEGEEEAFESTRCRFIVKEVKELQLPDFTDEFVKTMGVADVQTFMEHLEKDLNRQADKELLTKLGEQVQKVVCDSYQFEVPASLINGSKNSQVAREVFRLKKELHLSEEQIQEKIPEIEAKATKDLEEAYRWIFLVGKIATQYNIRLTREEILKETQNQLEHKEHNTGLLVDVKDQDQINNIITNHLMEQKVLGYVSALIHHQHSSR